MTSNDCVDNDTMKNQTNRPVGIKATYWISDDNGASNDSIDDHVSHLQGDNDKTSTNNNKNNNHEKSNEGNGGNSHPSRLVQSERATSTAITRIQTFGNGSYNDNNNTSNNNNNNESLSKDSKKDFQSASSSSPPDFDQSFIQVKDPYPMGLPPGVAAEKKPAGDDSYSGLHDHGPLPPLKEAMSDFNNNDSNLGILLACAQKAKAFNDTYLTEQLAKLSITSKGTSKSSTALPSSNKQKIEKQNSMSRSDNEMNLQSQEKSKDHQNPVKRAKVVL